jgi:putative hydrolase of the HAD superfamily
MEQEVRHLILDLGGVLFDVDYHLTTKAFERIGLAGFEEKYSQKSQSRLFDELEKGSIDASAFRTELRRISSVPVTDDQIDEAWNAMLLGFPVRSVELLNRLRGSYSLHLLSNTNPIHEAAFRKMFAAAHPHLTFDRLFDHVFLSHHIGMRKPDKEVFDHVIGQTGIDRRAAVFIDDSIQHVEGAERAGIRALWVQEKGGTAKLLETEGLLGQRRS